jgi:hypothetical protein
MKGRIHKIYLFTFWAPIFLSFCFWAYLKSLGGWSAWAAASIMSVPITFSAIYTLGGIILIVQSIKRKNLSLKLTLATLFAGLPILWFFLRMVTIEISRSF